MRAFITLSIALAVWAVAAPSQALAGIPTLSQGSQGGEVAIWQETMNRLLTEGRGITGGLSAPEERFLAHKQLSVDGQFGPATAAVTRAYQHAYKLKATGIVGLQSRKAWIDGQITCCGAGYPEVYDGGPLSTHVVWWQITLDRWLAANDKGVPQLIPDGIYGPLTEQATTTYQRAVGLAPDGIAGPKTWTKISNAGYAHLP